MTGTKDPIFETPDGWPRLVEVMRRLRDPNTGCPWDIEQNFATIAPYTIEEAYEVAEAIQTEDWDALEGELGDLLLQVIYHSQMGSEAGHFDLTSVVQRISAKMIDRHPHVFGDDSREKTASQQTIDWETAKAAERAARGVQSVLDDVAQALPALTRAVKLQKRAARVGFDWPNTQQVLGKIEEELNELAQAQSAKDPEQISEEFGDLLFVVANLSRHLGLDPEQALRDANAKFTRRFHYIEERLAQDGRRPEDSDLAEMDALWDAAKVDERLG